MFRIRRSLCLLQIICFSGVAGLLAFANSGRPEKAVPVFKDGEAQIVKRFEDPDFWIRHDLWVETESDVDKDGHLDRVHVAVTRPRQTDTEGLKLPVVYVTSPYFAGNAPDAQDTMWSPRQELGEEPPKRTKSNQIERKGERPII